MSEQPSIKFLPPPEGHSPDCLCASCFDIQVGRQDYSARVLATLAESMVGVLGTDATVWLVWLLNRNFLYPLSEMGVFRIVNDVISKEWGKASPFPREAKAKMAKSQKPSKRIGVEL